MYLVAKLFAGEVAASKALDTCQFRRDKGHYDMRAAVRIGTRDQDDDVYRRWLHSGSDAG